MELSRGLFQGVQSEQRGLGGHVKNRTFKGRGGERGERKSLRVKKGWTQGPEENLKGKKKIL